MNTDDLKYESLKYISTMGSIAHTYGNLLATAQKWVMDIFPQNFFKTIHVQSQIAHEQIMRNTSNLTKNFIKKGKPIIIFRPRITDDEDTFLAKTMIVERMGGGLINSNTPGTIELNPFMWDEEHKINLQFSQTRLTMYLDVMLIFETLIQQLNYYYFLKNELVKNRPFDIETWLEAYLPKQLMEYIGELSGTPLYSEYGSIKEFLDYMNGNSIYPVTYKLAGSTGKDEFYRYYRTNILTTMTDLDKSDGESVGQVMNNYQITFTLKMEFWAPGINYLFSPNIKINHTIPVASDASLIPVYADVFAYEDMHFNPGWKLYQHASYQLDKPNDEVDFNNLLDQSVQRIIDYHIENGIPLLNFIDVKVRRQGFLMDYGTDYRIDFCERKVYFQNKDYGWYTYTIVIAIDVEYINSMIQKLYHLE